MPSDTVITGRRDYVITVDHYTGELLRLCYLLRKYNRLTK